MCRTTYGDLIIAARLSESVYGPEAFIVDDVTSIGMTHVGHVQDGGAFATLSVDRRGCLWVAFRGTQISAWRDINADRMFWPRREGVGLAHRGFVSLLDLVWPMIEKECAGYPCRIILTGHSLGGALAKLAACRLGVIRRKRGLSKPDVISFGAPLIGSPSWVRHMLWSCGDVVRVTNGADPIPWMFAWPIYQHSQNSRLHLSGHGDVFPNPTRFRMLLAFPGNPVQAVARFIKAVWKTRSLFRSWLQVTSIFDHAIHRYRGQIVEIFEGRFDETID